MENVYDLVIIGLGLVGFVVGFYGVRVKLKILILEKDKIGG